MVRVGKIATIDYEAGMASVVYADRGDETSPQLPFFSSFYEMPEVDDQAVVVMLTNSRTKGFIIGVPYSRKKRPVKSGKGVFCKEFSDGTSILYDPEKKMLSVDAGKVVAVALTADNVTVKGKLKAKSIEAEQADIKELVVGTIIYRQE